MAVSVPAWGAVTGEGRGPPALPDRLRCCCSAPITQHPDTVTPLPPHREGMLPPLRPGEQRPLRRARRLPQGWHPRAAAAFVVSCLPCVGWKRTPHDSVTSRESGQSRPASHLATRMARPAAGVPAARPGRCFSSRRPAGPPPHFAALPCSPRPSLLSRCFLRAPLTRPLPREAVSLPLLPAPRLRCPSSISAAGVGEGGPSRPFLRLPCPCPRRRQGSKRMPVCLQGVAIPGPAHQSGPRAAARPRAGAAQWWRAVRAHLLPWHRLPGAGRQPPRGGHGRCGHLGAPSRCLSSSVPTSQLALQPKRSTT